MKLTDRRFNLNTSTEWGGQLFPNNDSTLYVLIFYHPQTFCLQSDKLLIV